MSTTSLIGNNPSPCITGTKKYSRSLCGFLNSFTLKNSIEPEAALIHWRLFNLPHLFENHTSQIIYAP
jgi:hypothetical protein